MTPPVKSLAFSRRALLTYVEVLALLIVSGIGFWLWNQPAVTDHHLTQLLFFVYAPFALMVFVAVRSAVVLAQSFSSRNFIDQVDTLQKRLNSQDDLLRTITDYAPSAISIFNDKNEYWFVNRRTVEKAGLSVDGLLGRTPVAVWGADKGRKIERHLNQARQTGASLDSLESATSKDGVVEHTQTHYQIMPPVGDFAGGVIARGEDVTQIIAERQSNESKLSQVIATLVAVVDRRDPYSAGHSARVGLLSRGIALEMQLPQSDVDAAEMAGSLMNFGKVLVSRSILTKTEGLTQDELGRVRDGILTTADILARIDFAAPVVPTLRQVLERVDGTGVPHGLKEDNILITARIVAVANAFVALVSPRAYRDGLNAFHAVDILAKDADTAYDRRVITTLQIYLRKNVDKLDRLTGVKTV